MSERLKPLIGEITEEERNGDIRLARLQIRSLFAAFFQGNLSQQDLAKEVEIFFKGLSEDDKNYFEEVIRHKGRTVCRITVIREEEARKAKEFKGKNNEVEYKTIKRKPPVKRYKESQIKKATHYHRDK